MSSRLFPHIENAIRHLKTDTISEKRCGVLEQLLGYLQHRVNHKNDVRLHFICTHNSRRSHLSQIWAQALAAHFKIPQVFSYSGGTEATALYPAVADTLRSTGFQIERLSQDKNPVYSIKFGPNAHPVLGFSKTFDNPFNPESGFAAVMTCSQADENCPFIAGADLRIPLTFEDPKIFDNTPQQMDKYRERSLQIATELSYVFSRIKA